MLYREEVLLIVREFRKPWLIEQFAFVLRLGTICEIFCPNVPSEGLLMLMMPTSASVSLSQASI